MADSNVAITAGTGTNIDTRTAPDGDHRQVVVLGDGTAANVGKISAQGGLSIHGASYTPTAVVITGGTTGNTGSVDVSNAGNVTFWVANSGAAFTGSPVVTFEQSYDGTNWAPLPVVRSDTQQSVSSLVLPTMGSNTAIAFDAAAEGVFYVRSSVTVATATGSIALAVLPGGGFFEPAVATVERNNAGRTAVSLYATGQTAGASGTEAMVTWTISKGTAATTTGTTYALGAGKTLRITGMRFQHVAQAANTNNVVWRLRLNTAGAVTTASTPILIQAVTRGAATVNSVGFYDVGVSEGLEIYNPASGTVNIGLSYTPTWTTTALLYDTHIVGYEY